MRRVGFSESAAVYEVAPPALVDVAWRPLAV